MNISLAWKPENLNVVRAPHFAVKIESGRFAGTYGVWALSSKKKGAAYAIGSGRGMSLEEAIAGAKRCNSTMHEPSEAMGQQF